MPEVLVIAYTCVAIYITLATNIIHSHVSGHRRELENHFSCEALGDPEIDCSREQFGQINRDSIVQTFVYITLSLYPSVFFIFLASPGEVFQDVSSQEGELGNANYISLQLTCTTLCRSWQ